MITDIIADMFNGFAHVALEVFLSLVPILIVFAAAQLYLLKLPRRRVLKMLFGMFLSFIGLTLFLQGVKAGFSPAGDMLGSLLGSKSFNWLLIPIGFILGFAVILAEPAVRVLNTEIEKVTGGAVRKPVMLYTLCFGVAFAVTFSMLRVLYGFSLWYIIIPGYVAVFMLSAFTNKEFVAIAFDSGGAATGPMTVTFILSMTVGAAKSIEGRDPLSDGFGMVSIVAMMPILSILILGAIYKGRERKKT